MAAYKDDAKGTWYCKFRYTDWQGNSKSTSKRGFKTKKEALAYEKDYKANSTEAPTMTIDYLMKLYLDDYKATHKESSFVTVNSTLQNYVSPSLGKLPVDKVTPRIIRKWQIGLPDSLSPSSIKHVNIVFSAMLTFAVNFYNLSKNPFRVTGMTGTAENRKVCLEPSDWKKVNEEIKDSDKYYSAMLNLLYWGGLRLGEARALSVKDIDCFNNTITINCTANLKNEITDPKTKNSNRTISMPHFVMMYIADYLDSLYEQIERPFMLRSSAAINRKLQRLCKLAEVQVVTPHGLRHSHASLLINKGLPVTDIAERLGDTSQTILNTYAHAFKSSDRKIADMLTILSY